MSRVRSRDPKEAIRQCAEDGLGHVIIGWRGGTVWVAAPGVYVKGPYWTHTSPSSYLDESELAALYEMMSQHWEHFFG